MLVIIIWVVFIIWLCVSVSKNKTSKQESGNRKRQQPVKQRNGQTVSQKNYPSTAQQSTQAKNTQAKNTQATNAFQEDSKRKQQELKARLEKKYQGAEAKPKEDILTRAKTAVAEDFADGAKAGETRPKAAGVAAEEKLQKEFDKEKELQHMVVEKLWEEEKQAGHEEEDVLKTVKELMVKGPDMELTFERDFLSEGMDMLNRFLV